MNEVNKCFGWICALNRRSVQERAHISFCLYNSSGNFIWRKSCADSRLNSEQIDTLMVVWGVRKGGLGGGCHFGPEAQN